MIGCARKIVIGDRKSTGGTPASVSKTLLFEMATAKPRCPLGTASPSLTAVVDRKLPYFDPAFAARGRARRARSAGRRRGDGEAADGARMAPARARAASARDRLRGVLMGGSGTPNLLITTHFWGPPAEAECVITHRFGAASAAHEARPRLGAQPGRGAARRQSVPPPGPIFFPFCCLLCLPRGPIRAFCGRRVRCRRGGVRTIIPRTPAKRPQQKGGRPSMAWRGVLCHPPRLTRAPSRPPPWCRRRGSRRPAGSRAGPRRRRVRTRRRGSDTPRPGASARLRSSLP